MGYTFFNDVGRSPDPGIEIPNLLSTTDEFFLQSIDEWYNQSSGISRVSFDITDDIFDPNENKFAMVGTIEVYFGEEGSIPSRNSVFSVLTKVNLRSYIIDSLQKLQPESNIFRKTMGVSASFGTLNAFQL